jgi:branched-chain amino acid transport system permease protein
MSKIKTLQLMAIMLTILLMWLAQNHLDDYSLRILTTIAIFIILATSYNLINGITGQLSLEPNGFVAVGAYVTALLLISSDAKLDMYQLAEPSPWLLLLNTTLVPALFFSGVVSAILAFILAFPVFRVRGDYLAIVTLGFGFIIRVFAVNTPAVTNGAIGLNDIPSSVNLYWAGAFAMATVLIMLNIIYSKYGRGMKAVRDDEDAASAMGVNTFKIKTYAFMTSAFFEGVGGGLLAVFLTTISPDIFTFFLTFQLIIIIVLGGLGSMTGTIIGAFLVIGGGEWLRVLDEEVNFLGLHIDAHPGMRMVVFSVILIVVMIFAREGIMGKRELTDLFRRVKK